MVWNARYLIRHRYEGLETGANGLEVLATEENVSVGVCVTDSLNSGPTGGGIETGLNIDKVQWRCPLNRTKGHERSIVMSEPADLMQFFTSNLCIVQVDHILKTDLWGR